MWDVATTKGPFPGAEEFLPDKPTLNNLREAARACKGCGLYLAATQTVFGEGPAGASIFFVGEQPGDVEDRKGRPFIGPAGALLDRALAEVGIDRTNVYVTNAVKHFNFEPRGKARLHKKPKPGDVRACAPWLRAELQAVKPEVLVVLGATAAQSLFGPSFKITRERGKPLESDLAHFVIATLHPSAILRAPDSEAREAAYQMFVADLKLAYQALGKSRTRKK